jgi:hypothetical protein
MQNIFQTSKRHHYWELVFELQNANEIIISGKIFLKTLKTQKQI